MDWAIKKYVECCLDLDILLLRGQILTMRIRNEYFNSKPGRAEALAEGGEE